MPGDPINYPDGAIPEFKGMVGLFGMKDTNNNHHVVILPDGSAGYDSISEFKQSLSWGAEIEFEWKGKTYGVMH